MDPDIICDSSLDNENLQKPTDNLGSKFWYVVIKVDGFEENYSLDQLVTWIYNNFTKNFVILSLKSKIIGSIEGVEGDPCDLEDHYQIRCEHEDYVKFITYWG